MSQARATSQLAERGEGRCAVMGDLTLESVPWLWRELQSGDLLHGAVAADLLGVTRADSAGLALLLAWRAACKARGHELHFAHVPDRLLALAKLTGAEPLLAA